MASSAASVHDSLALLAQYSKLSQKVSMGTLYASDIIMITVCLLLGLQSLPCQSTGKSNHQQRAL